MSNAILPFLFYGNFLFVESLCNDGSQCDGIDLGLGGIGTGGQDGRGTGTGQDTAVLKLRGMNQLQITAAMNMTVNITVRTILNAVRFFFLLLIFIYPALGNSMIKYKIAYTIG